MTEKEMKELLRELKAITNKVEEIYSMLLKKDGDFKLSVATNEKQEETEERITGLLRKLGAPVSNKGYRYIKESLLLCLNDPTILNSGITKGLYPDVAEMFNTTPSRVERNIRHEIELIFRNKKNNEEIFVKLFPYCPYMKKVTNSEFLATLVEYLRE